MRKSELPQQLKKKYKELNQKINERLTDFSKVPEKDYFYELCFCICTPQSKAQNAFEVQKKLMSLDFKNKPFDPVELLSDPAHYIRFHNQKAKRLLCLATQYPEIESMLGSNITPSEKRLWLVKNFNGFGMKESSHFLRNIGYRELAILDRHILKHLVGCGVYEEIPKISTVNNYLEVEASFKEFAESVKITIDELDILFWSNETGEILK